MISDSVDLGIARKNIKPRENELFADLDGDRVIGG